MYCTPYILKIERRLWLAKACAAITSVGMVVMVLIAGPKFALHFRSAAISSAVYQPSSTETTTLCFRVTTTSKREINFSCPSKVILSKNLLGANKTRYVRTLTLHWGSLGKVLFLEYLGNLGLVAFFPLILDPVRHLQVLAPGFAGTHPIDACLGRSQEVLLQGLLAGFTLSDPCEEFRCV